MGPILAIRNGRTWGSERFLFVERGPLSFSFSAPRILEATEYIPTTDVVIKFRFRRRLIVQLPLGARFSCIFCRCQAHGACTSRNASSVFFAKSALLSYSKALTTGSLVNPKPTRWSSHTRSTRDSVFPTRKAFLWYFALSLTLIWHVCSASCAEVGAPVKTSSVCYQK